MEKESKEIRPALKRLVKAHKTQKDLARFLGTTRVNVAMMVCRGFLSMKYSLIADMKSKGKYKGYLLCNKEELK